MKKKLNCVLLVDDNEPDNFLHARIIEKAGIADFVRVSLNGEDALDLLGAWCSPGQAGNSAPLPELIFLDINMPLMDGWEFMDEFRKLQKIHSGRTVIVMLTSSLNPSDISRTERYLGSGCLQRKPLTPETLQEIIRQHFPDYI
ncbi:MAG: response regulator [bacterium]